MKEGDIVGNLTLVDRYRKWYGKKKSIPFWVWICVCSCGSTKNVREDHLRTAKIKSCGCLSSGIRGSSQRRHGESWHRTVEYRAWSSLKNRCYNERNVAYPNYGGRGIKVCSKWLGPYGFENFLEDMGRKPSPKHSIDRINNDGDYCPENCRWATPLDQNRNTRVTKFITFGGETKSLGEWADQCGLNVKTLHNRIYSGWTVKEALFYPVGNSK